MRLQPRLEIDADRVIAFLNKHQPGHEWEAGDLGADTLKIVIERAGEPVAYLWFHWASTRRAIMHGCSKARAWPYAHCIVRIVDILRFFGIEEVSCEPIGPLAPAITRLMKRVGFIEDEGHQLHFLTGYHGKKEEGEDAEDGSGSTARPTGP